MGFLAVPAVEAGQTACVCGHATDLHELMDMGFADGEKGCIKLIWRFKCSGFFVIETAPNANAARCTCTNIRKKE